MATDTDYSHRTTVQKLGLKPDQRVEIAGDVGPGLRRDAKEAGQGERSEEKPRQSADHASRRRRAQQPTQQRSHDGGGKPVKRFDIEVRVG